MTTTPEARSAKQPSLGRSITIAALIMAASSLLSRLLGFLRVTVLAHSCGTGPDVDAYVVSFFIPDLINHLLAGSALSITFVPLFQKYWLAGEKEKAWRFFSNVFTVGTIGFILFIAASLLYTRPIFALFGKNINDPAHPEQLQLAVHLTRIILPAQLFFFWGALFNGVQYANRRFMLPALAPVLYNGGIILGGLLLTPWIGIAGFSWGVLVGGFVGNVLLQAPAALALGMRLRPRFDLSDPDLRRYALITLPFIVGLSMSFSNELLLRIFGSFTQAGAGALASLDFAYKLMFFLVGIFGQGLAAGAYPYISQLVIEKKFGEVGAMLANLTTRTAAVLIPVAGIMMILSTNLVTVLLQHGRFTQRSTELVSEAFFMYLPGAFFASAVLIINRVFYAMQKTVLPLVVNTIVVVLSLPLYAVLSDSPGTAGIALAATVSMFVLFLAMYGIYARRYPHPDLAAMARAIGLTCLVTAPAMGLCLLIKTGLQPYIGRIDSPLLGNILLLCAAGLPALALSFAALDLLGIQKIRQLLVRGRRSPA